MIIMSKRTLLIITLIVSVLLVSCTSNQAHIVKDKTSTNIPFLKPTDTQLNKIVLSHTVSNPMKYDFIGKITYKYNQDCITISPTETTLNVPIGKESADTITISPNYMRYPSYDETCYGTQNILLVLSNSIGTTVYDSQNVEISVTR